MLKSGAIVFVILAVVGPITGSFEEQPRETSSKPSPVAVTKTDNVSPGGKRASLDTRTQHHQATNFNEKEDNQPIQEDPAKISARPSVKETESGSEKPSTPKVTGDSGSSDTDSSDDSEVNTELKTLAEEEVESSEETRTLKKTINDDTGLQGDQWRVSSPCLDCLCRLIGCDFNTLQIGCEGRSCGPFGITYVFWEDAFDHKLPDGPSFEGKKGEVWDISMKCLDCLCDLASGCKLKRGCESPWSLIGLGVGFEKGDCGPFHISFPFWADARNVKMNIADAGMQDDWRRCSLDLECASKTIQLYFQKYPHDCNQDGKVDCLDYAAIHTLGPFGCMEKKKLASWNQRRRKELLQCLASKEDGAYTKKMHEIEIQKKKELKPHDVEVVQL